MALTSQQHEQFAQWIAARQVRPECPACGTPNTWTPGDVVAPLAVRPSGLHIGDPITPLVWTMCVHCGYILFFATAPMGLSTARPFGKKGACDGDRA